MTLADRMVSFFGARWIGHGRATEMWLSLIALGYGISLLTIPHAAYESPITWDFAWTGYGHLAGIPLIVKAIFSGIGVFGNIKGFKCSQSFRLAGAFLGCFIWLFMATKAYQVDAFSSITFWAPIVFFFASARVIGLSVANLPIPGAPGAV